MSFSQTDVLAEIANWDTHECQEKWSETLPKVMQKLKESTSSSSACENEKLMAIQIICNNFLSCVKMKEAEKLIFSRVCGEIQAVFDEYLHLIQDCLHMNQDENRDSKFVSESVNQSLRMILSLLECIESCISYVNKYEEAVFIKDISSLPKCVVYLIDGTYKHCKESSEMYKNYNLEMFSEILSMLFKKCHAIQINFLSLMDRLETPETLSERNIEILNTLCMGLFQICKTVTSLDIKLIVSLWKSISRLLVQYIQFIGEVVNVTEMVLYLSKEIMSGYQYLLQQLPDQTLSDTSWNQTDEKGFQKSVKILGFEIKILISLCKEYLEFLNETETDKEMYMFLIFINRNSPQWMKKKISTEHSDEINRQIVISCEPLLIVFHERPVFRDCLLGPLNILDENSFPHLLMLVSVTKSFSKMPEESKDIWMGITKPYETSHENIIETIFFLIEKCFVELNDPKFKLPGIMCSGTAQRLVSFYEFLVTHICGFIGSLLNKYFSILETTLLQKLFSESPCVQMMAVDCWCFMDRYGSAELCQSHVNFFLQIFEKFYNYHPIQSVSDSLIIILQRLFTFLEPKDQCEIMLKYSNPMLLKFWCMCPINSENLSTQQKGIITEVVQTCITYLKEWIDSSKTESSLSEVSLALKVMQNLFSSQLTPIFHSLMPTIADKLSDIWTVLCSNEWNQSLHMDSFIVLMLQNLSFIQMYFSDVQMVEIFSLLKEISSSQPSLLVLSEIAEYIQRCSTFTFVSPQIPVLIQEILISILTNENPLISHMIIETITQFAEKTSHDDIIPNCLKLNPGLESRIVNFINKNIDVNVNLSEYLTSQKDKLNIEGTYTWKEEAEEEKLAAEKSNNVSKPPSKRARMDSEDCSYETLLKNLQSDWSTFENLANRNPIPDWFKTSVKILMDKFMKKTG